MAPKTVEQNRNIQTVSLSEAVDVAKQIISSMPADEAPSILFVGPVGIGKTEVVGQIARSTKALGTKKTGLSLSTRHLSQVHPLDMAGVGLDNGNKSMYYAKPPLYEELMGLSAPRIAFFDEIDRAQPIAQSAMLQFLLSHEINGFHASDTYVLAAANMWHAQYTYELDKATASRLVILSIEPTKRDWMRWAAAQGVDARVLMTIESSPDLLNQHKGFDSNGKETNNNDGALKVADPRSWKRLSDALKAGFSTDYAAAFIGLHAANKLALYARISSDYRKEIAQVLDGKKVTLPATMDAKDRNQILFCVYLAAASQVRDVPTARSFLVNGSEQMDKERTYVVSKLITYTIDPKVLCADTTIQKLHLEMLDEIEGK